MKAFPGMPAFVRRRAEEAGAGVSHTTWDPEGPGVIRLHLVPPKPGLRRRPSALFINGHHIIHVHHGWAALLRTFMDELNEAYRPGMEVGEEGMKIILEKVAAHMHALYPKVKREEFIRDLGRFQDIIKRVAEGKPVPELEGIQMTLEEYAPYMRAPQRMDLAVKAMRVNGKWQCPLACGACYAMVGDAMKVGEGEELTTEQWFAVEDILWQAGVPQLSFTGGEPLERPDIAQLVAHASPFITRLNTSAVLLTPELARELHEASLDVLQVTFYSHLPEVHDQLVGRKGALERTLRGIEAAVAEGIQVSINTPLLPENADFYADTLGFLRRKGLKFFTCSSVLPAGGAKGKIASGDVLDRAHLFSVVARAKKFATAHNLELEFTSPGWLTEQELAGLGLQTPVCGACLGNMAIAPDGEVLPCQSWVHRKKALGNILNMPWRKIWGHPMCKMVRRAGFKNACPLAEEA